MSRATISRTFSAAHSCVVMSILPAVPPVRVQREGSCVTVLEEMQAMRAAA